MAQVRPPMETKETTELVEIILYLIQLLQLVEVLVLGDRVLPQRVVLEALAVAEVVTEEPKQVVLELQTKVIVAVTAQATQVVLVVAQALEVKQVVNQVEWREMAVLD